LINYTISHFSFEEELQRQHNYPSCKTHKQKHDAFIERISNYKQKHLNGEDIAQKLSGELILWLTSHIKKEDKDYIPYCNKPMKKSFLNKMMGKFFK
jgi:hemerythrin